MVFDGEGTDDRGGIETRPSRIEGRTLSEFAIVGLGAWGLCVLERSVHRARTTGTITRLHLVEPGRLGGGVYSTEQPDYLVLNNPCGQLSLFASPDSEPGPYSMGLYEWATARGYRWEGYECKVEGKGEMIRPTDYLPRRVLGEYLSWFYDMLLSDAPANLEIVRHFASATDITPVIGDREMVSLDNGTTITVDHVVLTSGHTYNDEREDNSGVRFLRPYPVGHFDSLVAPGAPIAIAGMGLVGFDLLTALSVGRGGTYEESGARLRYSPSGQEPEIYLYSRSGVPYLAKSSHGVDPTGDYRPLICSPETFAKLVAPSGSPLRRRVDFRNDLLPLLYAEMRVRYYTHAAHQKGGAAASSMVRDVLEVSWREGHFERAVDRLEPVYGIFDPASHVFADVDANFISSEDYQTHVVDMVETDLNDALMPGGSPVKAALEITRILRDQLRSVIEFGGLSLDSYIDFQANVRGRINRLEAGPPALRSQQLLALLNAGTVKTPFGPHPKVFAQGNKVIIASTKLAEPFEASVDHVVRGHLDLPSLARSSSPLLSHLYAKGRLTQFSYGDTAVGSVAISEDFHPYDAEGRLQENLSLLGVLTEGVRYFTHYLPSPRSRLRAVLDAQQCVEAIIV
ncbi:MAG: FAD/NAD(P)-binding protein [Acidimicrobiales bacterium]